MKLSCLDNAYSHRCTYRYPHTHIILINLCEIARPTELQIIPILLASSSCVECKIINGEHTEFESTIVRRSLWVLCVKGSEICNADIREFSLSTDGCCVRTRQRHKQQLQ